MKNYASLMQSFGLILIKGIEMKRLALVALTLFIIGCGGEGSGGNTAHFDPINASYSLQDKNSVITLKNRKDATLHIDLGSTPKSLYVVTTSHFDNQRITLNTSRSYRVVSNETNNNSQFHNSTKEDSLENRILAFNENTFKLLRIKDHSKEESIYQQEKEERGTSQGTSERFCVDMDSSYNCTRNIDATAVRVKSGIATTQGDRDLVIWLENGISIKSSALDNLSDIFLQSGLDNDIYDWETNIFSKEWGEDAQSVDSHLIGDDSTINILVYDMHTTTMAGFFWPKDNFKKSYIAASNEKIMFYVSAQLLNNDEEETFTTLDHEFQHMIHFYQRAVLKDIHDDTWFNEMMSETVEDLLAIKIGYKGPRNVDPNDGSAGPSNNKKGRYPSFNAHNTLALTSWSSNVANYGKVSAFGAYLNRNYGGASLLHKLMTSNKADKEALEEATGLDIHTLVNQWGTAVILSDQTDISGKLQYNRGGYFTNSYGDSSYQLGSINFFNYSPQPKLQNSATINNNANLYSKIGDGLTGTLELHINIPKGATISLIAK